MEEQLDESTRNEILSQVLNVTKASKSINSHTPILESAPISNAIKSNNVNVENITNTKQLCKNCNHKIWFDGEEWQHSGKEHDLN